MLARIRARRGRSSEFFCEFSPAAAKTAASFQEFNDEQEPGWIFGVMGGSLAPVTTGTDDLWDELVLDSGSVSTACPYAWCSDISVNNEDAVTYR